LLCITPGSVATIARISAGLADGEQADIQTALNAPGLTNIKT
jgi:hypothetical protein